MVPADFNLILSEFRIIVGDSYVLNNEESLITYGKDETEKLLFKPWVALLPSTTEEVSSIMKICFEKNIPVTPR
ncbi:MAG: hypothetical protein ABIP68_09255, partial [Ferruginibacter sp.]